MTVPTPIVWIGDDLGRVECQVMSAAVVHGRDDPTTQPVASTATLEILGPLPAAAVIGARVGLEAELDGTRYARFEGEITDLGVGWDSVDIARPRIIAAGDLARLGRRPIGDSPWGQELDGARVSRILTLAGFPPDPLLVDAGTVALLPRDVDRQPALELAQATAIDGAGMLWQDREGRIRYADALHRRGTPLTIELRACDIGLGVGWAASLEGLVNEAHIRYGVAPDGGEQPEVVARDQGSIDARGLFGASLSTQLATAGDAQKRADLTVARQSDPAWILDGLELDLAILDHARTAVLLASIELHELVTVTGLPEGSPASSAFLWVEGWRESVVGVDGGGVSWVISFATSDYCRTGAPPQWDDLPSSLVWDQVDPARTWNLATCIPPQPPRGRWNDSPASLRWDTTAPGVSWDTWPY